MAQSTGKSFQLMSLCSLYSRLCNWSAYFAKDKQSCHSNKCYLTSLKINVALKFVHFQAFDVCNFIKYGLCITLCDFRSGITLWIVMTYNCHFACILTQVCFSVVRCRLPNNLGNFADRVINKPVQEW